MPSPSSPSSSSSLSPIGAFSWVGAILVNAGFITLITWGASTIWFVGCVLCGLYSALLFCLADKISVMETFREQLQNLVPLVESQRTEPESTTAATTTAAEAENAGAAVVEEPPATGGGTVSILVSLLYGLAVLALGVTGAFPALNLFDCYGNNPEPNPITRGQWIVANASSLPEDVREWAQDDQFHKDDPFGADFLYIPATGVTLFSGSNHSDGGQSILWEVSNHHYWKGEPPTSHPDYVRPAFFTLVKPDTGCCIAGVRDKSAPSSPYPRQKYQTIVCSVDKSGVSAASNISEANRILPGTLLASYDEGDLWYKESPRDGSVGLKVYSLSPGTMASTLHSTYIPPKPSPGHKNSTSPPYDDDMCSEDASVRKKSLSALLLSALPMLVISIRLWVTKCVPSMAVTTLVAASLVYITVYSMIRPDVPDLAIHLWFAIGAGALWITILGRRLLVLLSSVSASDDSSAAATTRKMPPLIWGINAGGLCFFVGMLGATGMFDSDDWWRYLLATILCFVPLIVWGIGFDRVLLVVLGALGLLFDTWRMSLLVSSHLPTNVEFLVSFIVLGVGGILLGALGYWLSHYQDEIRYALEVVLTCQRGCDYRQVDGDDGEETGEDGTTTDPLLPQRVGDTGGVV